MEKKKINLLSFTSVISLFIVTVIIWHEIPQGLLYGIDGDYLIALSYHAKNFASIWNTTNISAIQGAFNVAIPINIALSTTLPFVFLDEELSSIISSLYSLILYALSVVFIARAVRLDFVFIPLILTILFAIHIYPYQYDLGSSIQFHVMPNYVVPIFLFSIVFFLISNVKNSITSLCLTYASVFAISLFSIISEPQ